MSSQILVWLLVVSLSVHACSARHLIIHDEAFQTASTDDSPPPQVGASSDATGFSSTLEEEVADGSLLGAITSAIKNSLYGAIFKEETAGRKEVAGQVLLGGHPRKQEKDDNIKERMKKMWRGRALMVGKKESDGSGDDESNETEEDNTSIVMMDYAQPHRKPPIHNENEKH
ncbi:hypothetical protein LINGRAHAP2_LOCUS25334 [Linum grandiflorum]